jgi:hypothetical protein
MGVCALTATSAAAENASISGAAVYLSSAGFMTALTAEKVAPAGFGFAGSVTVTVVQLPGAAPTAMTLDGSDATAISAGASTGDTLKDAVIARLGGIAGNTQADLDAYTAILKAAAGTDGLE